MQPTMAGLYIHIPFCRKACTYCNFHFSTSLGQKEAMLQAIQKEIVLQKNYLDSPFLGSIYFGGGTPSMLSSKELASIFSVIEKNFDLSQLKECNLEANPDDLNKSYIQSIKHSPINRFSIGTQSFRDEDLQYMNRAHNAQQAEYAIKVAQDAGFEKLSIDLIYGTPGMSNQAWLENLIKAEQLQIPHLSAYALTVEEGTALDYAIRKKKQTPVDAEQSAEQFELLMEHAPLLGYEQYEISNFAQEGQYAIHNTNYWKGVSYLGIGPSAHSFDGKNRRYNIANNSFYIKSVLDNNEKSYETEILSDAQRLNEYLMTGLRTKWGCQLPYIAKEWGQEAVGRIKEDAQKFIDKNWMYLEQETLLLSKSGKLYADHIASELFWVE